MYLSGRYTVLPYRVSPFGHPRINACLRPPDQLPACAGYKSFGFTFDQLRLPSASRSSGCAGDFRPTFVGLPSFGCARGSTFQLPPELHPALHLRISFQLAPDTASSDFTFGPTSNSSSGDCIFQLHLPARLSTFADHRPSGFAFGPGPRLSPELQPSSFPFEPASDSRRSRILRFCLLTQPPTLHRISRLQLHLPANRRFASAINLPDLPSV